MIYIFHSKSVHLGILSKNKIMRYLIISFLTVCLLGACDTVNQTTTSTPKDDLHGKWTIVSYSAFMPSLPEFSDGDVVWDFDSNKKTVTVSKKDPEKHRVAGMKPGTYPYSIKDEMLMINGSDYAYSFDDGKLKLDSNTDPRLSRDGPVIGFERIK